jgi:bifunctional DNA-binding transcriptional regulator/antitoxin component of YhaV-PrlF toxin-antitoxin module
MASYPLRIQAIRSKGQNVRFYVYLPMPLASGLGIQGGEAVEWEVLDRQELHLVRLKPSRTKTNRRVK